MSPVGASISAFGERVATGELTDECCRSKVWTESTA
jgi:hypothetical protein